jgi:hypothetical protein
MLESDAEIVLGAWRIAVERPESVDGIKTEEPQRQLRGRCLTWYRLARESIRLSSARVSLQTWESLRFTTSMRSSSATRLVAYCTVLMVSSHDSIKIREHRKMWPAKRCRGATSSSSKRIACATRG